MYDLDAAKYEYELLLDYDECGNIVRSRIIWYENRKKLKYFLNLEFASSGQTTIRRLFDSKGKLMVNAKFIMNELRDLITKTYTASKILT